MNLCTVCGEDFGSLSAFDRHRTGRYGHPYSEEHPDGRRCLNKPEMRAAGLHQDSAGRWRLQARGTPPWTGDVDARGALQDTRRPNPHSPHRKNPGVHIKPHPTRHKSGAQRVSTAGRHGPQRAT